MCGIFGIVSDLKFKDRDYCDMMRNAFVAGSLRGDDSSGIFQVGTRNEYYLQKYAEPGWDIIKRKHVEAILNDVHNSPITVGHNRAATAGAVIPDNAHPFEIIAPDRHVVLGVHNGTLSGWKYKKDASKFDVDSEWALSLIQKEKADAFESIHGAFAFVWWDSTSPEVLQMARNTERPMHYAYVKDRGVMVFASEHGMLTWLADRNRVTLEDKVYIIEPGKLYQFDRRDPRQYTKTNLPKASYGTGGSSSSSSRIVSPYAPSSTYTPSSTGTGNSNVEDSPLIKEISNILQLRRGQYVTKDEVTSAKDLNLYNKEVDVDIKKAFYDDGSLSVWGETTIDNDVLLIEMRRTSKQTFEEMDAEGTVKMRIIGMYLTDKDKTAVAVVVRAKQPAITVSADGSTAETTVALH